MTSIKNGSGPSRIRQINRKAVLSNIRYGGNNSRLKLGKDLGISAAAVTAVVSELVDEGLLKDAEIIEPSARKQGRPISLLELHADAAYSLGIVLRPAGDIFYIDLAWSDYTGNVTPLLSSKHYNTDSLQSIISGIHESLITLHKAVPNEEKIFSLTIGIPGVIENDNNIPIAPKLKCIEGTEFIQQIVKDLSYPVSIHNDVNLGTTSELHQQPRLRNLSFAYLHIYSGVGSGIALKGEILSGSHGWAGEIGHIKLGNAPNQYSFEQLLSTDGALADLLESLNKPRHALDELVPYLISGDRNVNQNIDEYCKTLCDAIWVLHSVLDLNEVMIDFPSDALFEQLLPKLEIIMKNSPNPVRISSPAMGHQAGLYGAALTALDLALDSIELRKK